MRELIVLIITSILVATAITIYLLVRRPSVDVSVTAHHAISGTIPLHTLASLEGEIVRFTINRPHGILGVRFDDAKSWGGTITHDVNDSENSTVVVRLLPDVVADMSYHTEVSIFRNRDDKVFYSHHIEVNVVDSCSILASNAVDRLIDQNDVLSLIAPSIQEIYYRTSHMKRLSLMCGNDDTPEGIVWQCDTPDGLRILPTLDRSSTDVLLDVSEEFTHGTTLSTGPVVVLLNDYKLHVSSGYSIDVQRPDTITITPSGSGIILSDTRVLRVPSRQLVTNNLELCIITLDGVPPSLPDGIHLSWSGPDSVDTTVTNNDISCTLVLKHGVDDLSSMEVALDVVCDDGGGGDSIVLNTGSITIEPIPINHTIEYSDSCSVDSTDVTVSMVDTILGNARRVCTVRLLEFGAADDISVTIDGPAQLYIDAVHVRTDGEDMLFDLEIVNYDVEHQLPSDDECRITVSDTTTNRPVWRSESLTIYTVYEIPSLVRNDNVLSSSYEVIPWALSKGVQHELLYLEFPYTIETTVVPHVTLVWADDNTPLGDDTIKSKVVDRTICIFVNDVSPLVHSSSRDISMVISLREKDKSNNLFVTDEIVLSMKTPSYSFQSDSVDIRSILASVHMRLGSVDMSHSPPSGYTLDYGAPLSITGNASGTFDVCLDTQWARENLMSSRDSVEIKFNIACEGKVLALDCGLMDIEYPDIISISLDSSGYTLITDGVFNQLDAIANGNYTLGRIDVSGHVDSEFTDLSLRAPASGFKLVTSESSGTVTLALDPAQLSNIQSGTSYTIDLVSRYKDDRHDVPIADLRIDLESMDVPTIGVDSHIGNISHNGKYYIDDINSGSKLLFTYNVALEDCTFTISSNHGGRFVITESTPSSGSRAILTTPSSPTLQGDTTYNLQVSAEYNGIVIDTSTLNLYVNEQGT